MNYKKLLEHSYSMSTVNDIPLSRLEYLGDYIFKFTTYDSEMSELFALKAIEVCHAINNKTTLDYIKDKNNYTWFLLMCNMPFFSKRIEYVTSIQGALWLDIPNNEIKLKSYGLWIGDRMLNKPMLFSSKEWEIFINDVIEFATPEIKHSKKISKTLT